MSLLDFFAAHAPAEIPKWFGVNKAPLRKIPDHHSALCSQPGFDDLSEQDKYTLQAWLSGGSKLPLPNRLCAIGTGAHRYITEARADLEREVSNREAERYFAWRWFYAASMVATKPNDVGNVDPA